MRRYLLIACAFFLLAGVAMASTVNSTYTTAYNAVLAAGNISGNFDEKAKAYFKELHARLDRMDTAQDNAKAKEAADKADSDAKIAALEARVAALENPPPPPPPGGEPAPIAGQGYSEVFRDDFDSISPCYGCRWYWPTWVGGPPASSVFAENGILHLQSRRADGYPEIIVSTETQDGLAWQYGYFEARMNWTGGNGAWPAFWLYSRQHLIDSDQCATPAGEIDVMEGQGSEPNVLYGTVHSDSGGCAEDQQNANNWNDLSPKRLADNWHTYSALWTPGLVKWYVDGQFVSQALTYPTDDQPMAVLLDMFTGGWTTGTDASSPGILDTQVDYVSVWQQ